MRNSFLFNVPIQGDHYRIMISPDKLDRPAVCDHDDRVIWMSPEIDVYTVASALARAVSAAWADRTKQASASVGGKIPLDQFRKPNECGIVAYECPHCGDRHHFVGWFKSHLRKKHRIDPATLQNSSR